ncbi:hypothetical protein NQ318_003742 [Aromia moschata]|uniref:Uncharacterized protein n=1 Tax=Aromia moschata TaxID=1265417 RepID=A0AAV8XGB5_9CUCU|nr:hypothetical protein NQ318_003742 [Aromia moschata]
MKIECARDRTARQWHQGLQEACGKSALPYGTVTRWVKLFNRGRQNVADIRRVGQIILVSAKISGHRRSGVILTHTVPPQTVNAESTSGWDMESDEELWAASSSMSDPELGEWKTLSWETLRPGCMEDELLERDERSLTCSPCIKLDM